MLLVLLQQGRGGVQLHVLIDLPRKLQNVLLADADGYVSYPNVNTVTEMTNLIDSTRAYEANATAFDASKAMAEKGLQIGK